MTQSCHPDEQYGGIQGAHAYITQANGVEQADDTYMKLNLEKDYFVPLTSLSLPTTSP